MNKDDEFALKNEEYDDDARAVKESELLPIYEAMSFSGDIQPLEDFETPEPEKAEYQQKKKSELKGADRKKEPARQISSIKRIIQVVLIAAIALVVLGAGGYGIYSAVTNRKSASPVNTIYSSGKTTYLALEDKRTFEIPEAEDIRVSKDGSRVYFCKNTSSKTGTYDIKLVDTAKSTSLKRGGSVICVGADEGWQINTNGTLLSYSKKDKGITKHYLYSAEAGKTVEIATDVDQVFLPSKGDVVYYTRTVDKTPSIHRVKFEENPEMVATNYKHVKFCDSEDGSELLYTLAADEDGTFDVYSVKDLNTANKICTGVSEVYLNDYVYGGNLYYFTKQTSAIDWQNFIYDKYAESDAAMTKPVESDYMVEYGFIIKRYILNESAFDAAKAQYNAKLKRDAIREALDKLNLGLEVSSTYDCHVFNAFSNQTLATGIYLDNMLAYSPTGAPRVIFRKSLIDVDDQISMDKLMSLANGTDASDAVDYVRRNVGRSFSVSDKCVYSWFDGNKVIQFAFTDYKDKNTIFFTPTSSAMYGFFAGRVYCDTVSSTEFGKPERLADNVSECAVYNGFVYYQKMTDLSNSSLYRYSPETGEQHLGNNINSYVVMNDNCVVMLSISENTQALMNMSVFDGNETKTVDEGISINHFIYNGNTAAYLKISGDDSSSDTGEMYVWTAGGEPTSYSNDVSNIKYIKDLK